MRFSAGRCCCGGCTTVRKITSWGSNSTTIGQGATEQNGNWEILSGLLRVSTADAIITWDAGRTDWTFLFSTGSMSWNVPGSIVTDYTKELRFIFNFVDNSNYDYVSLRKTAAIYLASFGARASGVDTIYVPVPGGGGALSAQYAIKASSQFSAVYKNDILHLLNELGTTCGGSLPDSACNGKTWYRPRVNNIIGIGTGPTWTGNVDIGTPLVIASAASAPCSSGSGDCWYPTKPACGSTTNIVANSVTATLGGTPYVCYPEEQTNNFNYRWIGSLGFPVITLDGAGGNLGDILVESGSNSWLLANGGVARTDGDSWTSLNIPPVSPNVTSCTLTGNY